MQTTRKKEKAQDKYFPEKSYEKEGGGPRSKSTKVRAVFGNLLTDSFLSAYLYLSGMGRGGIELN